MFSKLFAIGKTTFFETVRQPIFSVLLWVAAAWVGFVAPALATYSLDAGSDIKIMKDVALSTMLLYGLLASVFSATGVITREIESFTVMTVISKPVSRPVFLLGKFLGVAAALAVAYFLLAIIFMMTIRHGVMETATDKYDMPVLLFSLGAIGISLTAATFGNYVYGWHFASTLLAWVVPLAALAQLGVLIIDPAWQIQPITADLDLKSLFAVELTFFAVLILAAFAVALSTRFSQVMTLVLCAGVFVVGLLSDYYIGQRTEEGLLFQALYHALPNFQFFWIGDAITQERDVSPMFVLLGTAYAVLYTAAVLCVGIAMFQNREVG